MEPLIIFFVGANKMIPNILHFIWIQRRCFGRQEYMVIKSALKNTRYHIILHTNLLAGEAGKYCPYTLLGERFTLDYQPYTLEYKGIKVRPATLCDILRIKILQEQGGIYSDLDMFWFNPLPSWCRWQPLIGIWENQSYKIVTNSIIASRKGFDFTPLLKTFDLIFDGLKTKGITDISGDTLKEHLTLFKPTGDFIKSKASFILKKRYFNKNNWRKIYGFLTGSLTADDISLDGICGLHLCGCGLFGQHQIDTTQLLLKHPTLKMICESLEPKN